MLKPPSQTVPGMTDTLEFVKNLWGGMGVPGMSAPGAPALSTDDLDKRITDLKAVESWLNLNLTMLRTSIQALEVQRGTLATLKSMSESMAQAMGQKGDQTASLPPFSAFFNPAGVQQAGTPPPPSGPGKRRDAGCHDAGRHRLVECVAGPVQQGGRECDTGRRGCVRQGRPTGGRPRRARSGPARQHRAATAGGTPGTSSPKPSRDKIR